MHAEYTGFQPTTAKRIILHRHALPGGPRELTPQGLRQLPRELNSSSTQAPRLAPPASRHSLAPSRRRSPQPGALPTRRRAVASPATSAGAAMCSGRDPLVDLRDHPQLQMSASVPMTAGRRCHHRTPWVEAAARSLTSPISICIQKA